MAVQQLDDVRVGIIAHGLHNSSDELEASGAGRRSASVVQERSHGSEKGQTVLEGRRKGGNRVLLQLQQLNKGRNAPDFLGITV